MKYSEEQLPIVANAAYYKLQEIRQELAMRRGNAVGEIPAAPHFKDGQESYDFIVYAAKEFEEIQTAISELRVNNLDDEKQVALQAALDVLGLNDAIPQRRMTLDN